MREQKQPDRIFLEGGKEFRLYNVYDELEKEYILDLPNFEENPEYTNKGNPFVLIVQESCPNGKSDCPEDLDPGNCGGCVFFRQEVPFDPIGVCMCDERKIAT